MKLKELREKKKIRQINLAKEFNVAQNTISNWEIGTREPDTETLIKLAAYFGVTVDQLLGRESIYKTLERNIPYLVSEQEEEYKNNPPPTKEPTLTKQDREELKRDAEHIKNVMMSVTGFAFNNKPQDDETYEKVMAALEEAMILARKEAQRKYTPKKYRKKEE